MTEDPQEPDNPFQLFPNKIHLQIFVHYWTNEKYLLVPKSRQMTLTWAACGLYLHDGMFNPSRSTMFQCKIEEDSDKNLKRAFTMWEKLPDWQKNWQPMHYTYCNAKFTRSRSEIAAVAAGSKHYRQKTLSGSLVDEAAFTDELDEVIAAAKPALGEHGRFTLISSANPGYFKQLVFNEV